MNVNSLVELTNKTGLPRMHHNTGLHFNCVTKTLTLRAKKQE